jgi:hypothetical protein
MSSYEEPGKKRRRVLSFSDKLQFTEVPHRDDRFNEIIDSLNEQNIPIESKITDKALAKVELGFHENYKKYKPDIKRNGLSSRILNALHRTESNKDDLNEQLLERTAFNKHISSILEEEKMKKEDRSALGLKKKTIKNKKINNKKSKRTFRLLRKKSKKSKKSKRTFRLIRKKSKKSKK